jgi:hypothetical protein
MTTMQQREQSGELTNIGEVINRRLSESSIAEALDEERQVCVNDGGRNA